jgi:hypothetical protein
MSCTMELDWGTSRYVWLKVHLVNMMIVSF